MPSSIAGFLLSQAISPDTMKAQGIIGISDGTFQIA
jgi:hypothetical protein